MRNTRFKWFICVIVILGNFVGMLDSTTVQLALYPIAKNLNITLSQIQWIIVAYMLILTVFLPFFGKLGDLFPKNKIYSTGFLIFGTGALLNCFAPNFGMLIVFRCIEALGASILVSNGNGIIATLFKGKDRGTALGLNASIIAIGGMTGPALGGAMIHFFGWRSIFAPVVPIALISAYLSYKLIPSYHHKKEFKFDYKGFIYFTIALFALLLAISEGHSWGWKSLKIAALGVLTLVFGGLFYFRDKKINYPMINFKMFKIKTFTLGNIAVMTSYMAMFTNSILLPMFLQGIMKYNAFIAGLLILPYSLAQCISSPFAGSYAGKHGSKLLTRVGPCIYITALLIFTTFDTHTKIWEVIFASIIMGIGNGCFQSPSNNAILTSVKKEELGIASGILSLARNLGNILGVAITITLFEQFRNMFADEGFVKAFLNSYHLTMVFGIVFALICLICSIFAYRENHEHIHV
ncbi:MAG: MFS transporter [Cyanobacteriota bacterium]|nr:MFS transporter [Cyanobacteriota bacterium]